MAPLSFCLKIGRVVIEENIEMKYGVLPSQMISELLTAGFISNGNKANVCTDTYDVVVGDELYRMPNAFLPLPGERVIDQVNKYGIKVRPGSPLERGVCYLWRVQESITKVLPDNIFAYLNPKSNIGRVDMLARLLVDGVSRYDFIPAGYTGPLWAMIEPNSFSVIAHEGASFNQIRFMNRETRLDEVGLGINFDSNKMLFDRSGKQILYGGVSHSDHDGSILLTLGLDFETIGYEAKKSREPIDLSLKDHYDPREFFSEIYHSDGQVSFRENSFNILSTEESVRVPDTLACEMRPMDERSGEFRTHYAGYIAPGWGMGKDSDGFGKPLTLEVRFFSDFRVRRGQPFAKIRFERMLEAPEVHYDAQTNIKFGVQTGPGLAKYFKKW